MRVWLVAMLLLTTLLAGCSEDPAAPDDGDDGTGGDDGGDGGGGATNNTAPTATLAADLTNGTAPLQVNLTLDGADADGDNLTWTLSLAGNVTANGTVLPATLNFTLDVGNHTFALTVSDGNLSATANVTIVVTTPAPPEEPGVPEPEDRGWYMYDPVTSLCHVKDYTAYGPVYVSSLGGGTWVLAETNGEPGLQIANNHPTAGMDLDFDVDVPDCVDGDQVLV